MDYKLDSLSANNYRILYSHYDNKVNDNITVTIDDNDKLLYFVVNPYIDVDYNSRPYIYDTHRIIPIKSLKERKTVYQHTYGFNTSNSGSLECIVITIKNNTINFKWDNGVTNDNVLKEIGVIN